LIRKILENKKWFLSALSILILISVILIVILYSAGFYSISADESGRTLLAYEWINKGYTETPTWLPFHTILSGTIVGIFPDLFWTPRIIGASFGVLAFVSFIWLTHKLFNDRYITLFSSVIALFFPTRVILSAVPLTESMFFFFIFSGITFFIIWLKSGKDYNLILSACAMAVSTSIRYEGWTFSVSLLCILIMVKKLNTREVLSRNVFIVSCIIFAFPLYWLTLQTNISGNPFQFFEDASRGYREAEGISFFTILKNNYLTRFIHHNLIYICFPGIISSFYLFFRDNVIRKFLILLFIAFIPLALLSFTGRGIPTHNIWRVPEIWNILLIPFTVYFIKNIQFFEAGFLKRLRRGKFLVILALLLIYYIFHIYRLTGINAFTWEELETGRYVESELIKTHTGKDRILIEVPDWSYLNIIVASNKPEAFIRNSDFNPKVKTFEIISRENKIKLDDLSSRHIKYLLLKSRELQDLVRDNPFFRKKKSFTEWTVYEL